jgi:hypothetical protein
VSPAALSRSKINGSAPRVLRQEPGAE